MDPSAILKLYRQLLLARKSEEKIGEDYFDDVMKTPVHIGIGGEAIPIGVCHAMPAATATFATYRNHTLYLVKTDDPDGFFAELYGKMTGRCKGKAGSMHICDPAKGLVATSAVVGTTIPVAVGAALANRYRGSNDPVAVFFGDGAIEEGVFMESVNFAALRKLPVLFVCEDNDLAIHTFRRDRQGFDKITDIVKGYRVHVDEGQGTDLAEVVDRTSALYEKMRKDNCPGFLHLHYYRNKEHVGPLEDYKFKYRNKPEDKVLAEHDPVARFTKYALSLGIAQSELDGIAAQVSARIEESVKKAVAAPFPPKEQLYADVFADSIQ